MNDRPLAPARVWAPDAVNVSLRRCGAPDAEIPAHLELPGWFQLDQALAHGDDYWIVVDGKAQPDPLGRRLPNGVNRASRHWDASGFSWSDHGWLGKSIREGCIYELHVGTFTDEGTLDAAIGKLDWISDLGVTHVELLPLAAFDGTHGWGYDGVALNAVHEPYGGPDALCRFVDACHAFGLAVILDVVQNHLGPSGNHWPAFGPLTSGKHRTPWGDAINLDDERSDDVRRILLDSALGWLRDFHIDGLRLDAIHELIDDRALPYLEELAHATTAEAARTGRTLELIGESDRNDPRTVMPRHLGGLGLTAQWDDDVHHALHWMFTGETSGYYLDFGTADAARYTLEHGFLHDGRWSTYRGRSHGRPIDFSTVDPWRLVVALQTHDQVGNRAQGDRLSHLASIDSLAGAAAVLLSLPYTPMIFMGEEWGATSPWQFFTSFPDTELGAAVTSGRRSEFSAYGWDNSQVPDPQDPATFARSKLRWDETAHEPHQRLVAWYRDLLTLRRKEPGFGGADASAASTAGGVSAWIQPHTDGRRCAVAVITRPGWATLVNNSAQAQSVQLADPGWNCELAWPSRPDVNVDPDGRIELPAGSTYVLRGTDSPRARA